MKKIISFLIFLPAILISCGGRDILVNDPVVNPGGGQNYPPNAPSNPRPFDGNLNANRHIELAWDCTDPNPQDTLRFDIYISYTFPPENLFRQNYFGKLLDVGLTLPNIDVYWKIVAKDGRGGITPGPVWYFRTSD